MLWTVRSSNGSTLMRLTSPSTRIMGGRPEDKCKSEAFCLKANASSSAISMCFERPRRWVGLSVSRLISSLLRGRMQTGSGGFVSMRALPSPSFPLPQRGRRRAEACLPRAICITGRLPLAGGRALHCCLMATRKTRSRRRPSFGRKPHSKGRSRATVSRRRPLVGFIGAGNMARSLAGGLIANGWPPARIVLSDPDPSQRDTAEERLKVKTYIRNADVVSQAQILVLAVKPQVMHAVATEIAPIVRETRPLVISIAAGIRVSDLERWLSARVPLVRAMPNMAALVGSGASGPFANSLANERMRAVAESILRAVGVTAWLKDESLLDVVTALSGSGAAYFFSVMEALERA